MAEPGPTAGGTAASEAGRLHVVIPAFQESASIGATLTELRRHLPCATAVVVDDGSTDDTASIAAGAGAHVLRLPFNLGVGAAVRTGLRYSCERGADRVAILDADGQHGAADLVRLVAALDDADFVVGSRFRDDDGYDVGRLRRGAMRSLQRLVRLTTRLDVTDPTSGFRAMRRPVAELLARRYPVEYLADTVEVLVIVARAGHRIGEIGVSMRPRTAGVASSRRLRLVVNYLRLVIGVLATATRRPPRVADERSYQP